MNALQEVWIRPRKVFREISNQPVGATDFLLSAAQGIVGFLAVAQMTDLGKSNGAGQIFLKAALDGSVNGIAIIWIQAWIYTWMGRRAGGGATRSQIIHVLAYGGAPLCGSLAIWCLAAALLGSEAFVQQASDQTDNFVVLLMILQVVAHTLLGLWSVVLQIMGLSEMNKLPTRGAIGTFLVGLLLAALFWLVIRVLMAALGWSVPAPPA